MNRTIRELNVNDPKRYIKYLEISLRGFKYKLLRDYSTQTLIRPSKNLELGLITLYTDGRLRIKKDFMWQGADYIFDTDSVIRPSLIHDCFCHLRNADMITQEDMVYVNDRFMNDCKTDGAWKIRYLPHRFLLKKYWQGLFS